MNTLRNLWINKNDERGRISITLFFVNIFLLLCHIFFMVIYIKLNHKFMITMNTISIVTYLIFIFLCFKKPNIYMKVSFFEIWIHMLCAVISFGWDSCFQNWTFAMIVAYFLPAFSIQNKKQGNKLSFLFACVIVLTYFLVSILNYYIDFKIRINLDYSMTNLLFIVNNLISFITISMLALFYSSTNKKKVRELSRIAKYDELTNLYNRYALNKISEDIISNAKENGKPYSIAIMDIDFFKDVNDNYGHNAGDIVLEEFANILRSYSIRGIVSGRWGGEEFIMISPYDIKYEQFLTILERLRVKVSKTKFQVDTDKEINITISIGVSKIDTYDILEDGVKKADSNLYKAKNSGRNKIVS